MSRLEKLEAVVEAARRAIAEWDCDGEMDVSPMRQALAALDAHTEAPQTVTLALWRGPDGRVALDIAGSDGDTAYSTTWTRLGVFTVPLNREGGR